MPALVQEARSSQAAGPGPLGSSSSTGSGSRKRVLILSSSPDSLLSSSETDLCSCSDGDVSSHPDEPPSSSPAPDAAAADLERAGDYTQPSPGASWSSDAEMEALDASSQSLGQLDDVTDEEQQDEGAEDEEDEPTSTQEAQSILRKNRALAYIEGLLVDFFIQLQALATQSSKHPLLSHYEKVAVGPDSESLPDEESGALVHQIVLEATRKDKAPLIWPRRTGKGTDTALTLKMARTWRILEIMHEALHEKVYVTKRHIFYKDVDLFGRQRVVDGLVEAIASSAGLQRSDFNVRASPKGLFSSSAVTILLQTGVSIESVDGQATLVPYGDLIESVQLKEDVDALDWVVIVEKDAIFQSLCSASLPHGDGVLLTGKGYPDLSTRQLVFRLSQDFPDTPIYALVDCDPDGIEILSTYKYGSRSMARLNESLAVERILWLGLKASDWSSNLDYDLLIPLSQRDRNKILKFLQRPVDRLPSEWKRELSNLYHLGHKAEIEIMTSVPRAQVPLARLLDDGEPKEPASSQTPGGAAQLGRYISARMS